MLFATCSASAAVVATPPLGTPIPYWTLVSHYCFGRLICRGMPAYRFEQRSGPVLVNGQTSPLLDGGALHGVLHRRVSLHSQLRRNLRQRLFEQAQAWWDIRQLGERWPAAERGQGCTLYLDWQTHDGYMEGWGSWRAERALDAVAASPRLLRSSLARREFPGSSKMSRPGTFNIDRPAFSELGKSRKMSKNTNDGDVLANRLSLGLAKHQKLLASWMGSQPDAQPANNTSKIEEEDSELKQDFFGHDR
jgi:hypothetical protein